MKYEFGDIILVNIFFTDFSNSKKRPAVVLFEEFDNLVVAGITSNVRMSGISIDKSEGVIKNSVIKTNYLFTVSKSIVIKKLFSLSKLKKKTLCDEVRSKICGGFEQK